MKKIKRDGKSIGRKIATGIILVCVLAVGAGIVCKLLWLKGQVADNSWNNLGGRMMSEHLRIYNEVQVSDDGRWYQIPEMRVRFPFFATFDNAGVKAIWQGPLRYAVWAADTEDEGGSPIRLMDVKLAYDYLLLERFMGGVALWTSNSCTDLFTLSYGNFEEVNDEYYEKVAVKQLRDGRTIGFLKRKDDARCVELLGEDGMRLLTEQFSKFESY